MTTKRAGESDALAHAARKLLGIGGLEAVEADEVDGGDGAAAALAARDALRLEAQFDIAEDGEPGEEREGLEHHGDALRRLVQLVAAIGDAALRGRRQPGEDAQEGRLAGARLAEDGDDLAFAEREVDVVEDQPPGMVMRLIGLADLRGGDEPLGGDGGRCVVHQSSRSRSSARV